MAILPMDSIRGDPFWEIVLPNLQKRCIKPRSKGLLSNNKVMILQCVIDDTCHIFVSAFLQAVQMLL